MMRRLAYSLLCLGLMSQGAVFAADNRPQLKKYPEGRSGKIAAVDPRDNSANPITEFQAQDFKKLLGMKGFSDKALTMHFKLYEGYVKNANILTQKLRDLAAAGNDKTQEYAGLKRMYGWEFDGMRLHEYYFGGLGGDGTFPKKSALAKAIDQQYGSYENWKKDFEATGMIRGIGWAILYYDGETGRLTNSWINEHNLNHLAGNAPILTMDVFEHAYLPDYGLERAQYIDAFFNNIDWKVISDRYDKAVANGEK